MQKLQQTVLPFIDAIGNKLGINARYFTYQGFFAMQAYWIHIAYGLAISYLSARIFDPEIFGQYRFVLTIIGVLGVLKLGGISTAIAKDLNQHKSSPLLYTLKMYSIPALLFSVSLLATIPLLQFWNRSELWPLFVVAAVLAPIEGAVLTFTGGIITGKALFKQVIPYSIVAKILSVALISLMFVLYPSPSILICITLGINTIVYGLFAKKHLLQHTNTTSDNRILSYGTKLSLINVPGTIVWYVDNLMITAYFGLTQLAVFSVALMIPEQVKMLFKELLNISFSRQAQGEDSKQRRKKLMQFCTIGTIGFIGIIGLYWVSADLFFSFLFPKYSDPHVVWLSKIAFATLIVIPWNLVPQYLEAHGATIAVRNSNLFASGVFLVCLLLLIPQYHLLGAIISRGIFRVCYITTAVWYLLTHPNFTNEK